MVKESTIYSRGKNFHSTAMITFFVLLILTLNDEKNSFTHTVISLTNKAVQCKFEKKWLLFFNIFFSYFLFKKNNISIWRQRIWWLNGKISVYNNSLTCFVSCQICIVSRSTCAWHEHERLNSDYNFKRHDVNGVFLWVSLI